MNWIIKILERSSNMGFLMLAVIVSLATSCTQEKISQEHPGLTLTSEGAKLMRQSQGTSALFDRSFDEAKTEVESWMALGIDVPVPKDLAGGYTHEAHKRNFFMAQKAGVLFQITQDEKYAVFMRDMFLEYAKIYPTFDKHPATRSYSRGKFFWQCLNDANWLVYMSQGYDCIYDWLDENTRNKLNKELFRPYAEYISIENPQFFNRIHNHSTWGNAGVGMIGLVMDDQELVNWALYGLEIKVPGDVVKDNDGGDIKLKGQDEAGFFAQLDHSFSPDGYYTEGPYYQRYAMYPFLIFAQALANKKPELEILDYRNGLLMKAVYALINQTNDAGEFFPINDSQKGMSLMSRELVNAVSMAYYYAGKDATLLSIVEKQDCVPLNDAGLAAAQAVDQGLARPYKKYSMELSDGAQGDEGAIGILRSGNSTLVMKYAKHGMGHGHFDRLGFLLYNGADEAIQDYGAARWVNIEHKDGGGYLKENHSWAKHTVAHNALVVNNISQFGGNVRKAEANPGTPYLFDSEDPKVQVMSAKELKAYEGVVMQRTMAMINIDELENPLILDLMSVVNDVESDYQMPLYYLGELMSTNEKIAISQTLAPMGEDHGYQHLWEEANSNSTNDIFQMTWFNKKNFFTMTSATQENDEWVYARIGANDPNFNLRRDPGLLHSRTAKNTLFVNTYESHGKYDYASEIPTNLFTSVSDLRVLFHSVDYSVVQFTLKNGDQYQFCISQNNKESNKSHTVELDGAKVEWTGTFQLIKNQN
ncbi:MAG: heparinase II/III family protein [Cyclobacteriaceae bacterium]